jgi:hypothetical protein
MDELVILVVHGIYLKDHLFKAGFGFHYPVGVDISDGQAIACVSEQMKAKAFIYLKGDRPLCFEYHLVFSTR